MTPTFFPDAATFRRWLEENQGSATELWVGYHKQASGLRAITWPESVDQALCFGWIDGLRKSVNETSYMIRFTPRRKGSRWSALNVRRFAGLRRLNLVHSAGLAAFESNGGRPVRPLRRGGD